jgi:hypothetical protein
MSKKRLTREEWSAKEAKRRQRQAERNFERWHSRQAQRNYLLFHSSRSPQDAHSPSPVRNRGAMAIPDAEGDVFWTEVRPDKRCPGDMPISLSLTVSAGVMPQDVVRHLIKAASLITSPDIQFVLQGNPLAEPQLTGYAPNLDTGDAPEPWERAHAEQTSAPVPPSGTSQEALILTLAETVGYERAVDILLRAMGDEPTAR